MDEIAHLLSELERLHHRATDLRAREAQLADAGENDPASDTWKTAAIVAASAEDEFTAALVEAWPALSRLLREAAEGWRPISEAKKDGTIIWAKLRDDIYPVLKPSRDDLLRWNGVQIPLRHPGVAEDGFDIGWGVAAPVGVGGFPDEWVEGFRPLPSPPSETGNG